MYHIKQCHFTNSSYNAIHLTNTPKIHDTFKTSSMDTKYLFSGSGACSEVATSTHIHNYNHINRGYGC